ncbi:MAG: hypothetical protein KGI08_03310, partial [Thaumarchaeota archaeon]|nr:hypothetical protein [Nitrososphaerota archaeon]
SPFLICKIKDVMSEVFEALLVIWSNVFSPTFVAVTVTKSDEACAAGMRMASMPLIIKARMTLDFNILNKRATRL